MFRRNRAKNQLVALFVLGVFLLLPPLLTIFNHPVRVLGLPVLYFYLFLAWVALIGLTAAVVRYVDIAQDGDVPPPGPRASERQGDA